MSDSIFGISERALQLSEGRAVLLSGNIVNSSTPHYKARDINFNKILQEETNTASRLATTEAKHMQASSPNGQPNTMYRIPMQKNMDGNTVDEEIERKNFLQNSLNYQVNLTFIKNTTDQLHKAIKGE